MCIRDRKIVPLYQQSSYVELAVNNVLTALRDGAVLVAIVVFLFLASFRTTFVTLVTCLLYTSRGQQRIYKSRR